MQAMDEAGNDLMQHLQGHPFFSVAKHQHCHLKPLPMHPISNASQSNSLYPNFAPEAGKPSGVPPASPYSQFLSPAPRSPPPVATKQLPPAGFHHSRSRSQPTFFSIDTLPPINYRADSSPTTSLSDSISVDVSMDDHDVPSSRASPPLPQYPAAAAAAALARDGLPPRKGHQRSQSDIPFVFAPLFLPLPQSGAATRAEDGFLDYAKTTAGVKLENCWDRGLDADGVSSDDLFNAYMNLDGFDALNSSDDNRDDLNSRDSGSKTNAADSSENEADSIGLCTNEDPTKEGMKRSAAADPAQVPTSRHCRSQSMDSFMGKFNFEEEPPKPLPSHGLRANSLVVTPGTFRLEFGNGQFTAGELKKIMENEKLVEMAMADPKRVKRILANRQSAARSKERKMRYIAELEHKVQTLQTETTTLSAQLTVLQRDSNGLINQNNELKFRLKAMEQQAQLSDALNEALTAEVRRLKLAATGMADTTLPANNLNHQICMLQSSPDLPLYRPQKQENSAEMDSGTEQ